MSDISFTKQELIDVIASADDSIDSSVVVTKDGQVLVVSLDEAQANPENYAVRHETFDAGNDFLGSNASEDPVHIERTFSSLVDAWEKHKATGQSSVYAG